MSQYLEKATQDDPQGAICAHCGGKNDWCDDLGFFYCTSPNKKTYGATCKECFYKFDITLGER